jgi:hypothetical protein
LKNGEVWIQIVFLLAHTAFCLNKPGVLLNVHAKDFESSGTDRAEPVDHANGRCFSGPVGTEDTEALSPGNAQRYTIYCLQAIKGFAEIFGKNERFRHF